MEAILEVLAGSSVRAIVIAIGVASVLLGMRVKSPAIRHRAWTWVLLVMLTLPALSIWVPRIAVPILPPASLTPAPGVATGAGIPLPDDSLRAARAATPGKSGSLQSLVASEKGQRFRSGAYTMVITAYLIGLVLFVVRLLIGMVISHRLARGASRDERCCYSSRLVAPLTAGLLRARVFLPLESKNWDSDRISAVLTHEEEHIRRHDPLVTWLALLNRCIYWFHPLAWWLCTKLSDLSEQSCDETVIARGHDPGEYVGSLLDFAHTVKQRGALVAPWGSPLQGSTLALRIRRIASAGRDPAMSRVRMILVIALCVVAALVPAICTLARAQTAAAKTPAITWPATGAERSAATAWQFQSRSSDTSTHQDRVLYKAGLELLKKHQYAKARREFQKLIDSYPDSKLAASAYLAIGDAYYEEGGTENLLMAQDQYRNFAIFFPTHPKAAEARKKGKMKEAGDDNHDNALLAESAARKSIEQDLGRDYVPVVRETYYRKWLDEDVLYIITGEEKRAFLNLESDEERDNFIEEFWARRNPNPGSEQNSFKQEHYRRLAYANERFACNIPGWKTDRGRIYIMYGAPDEIESRPQPFYGYQRWFYRHIEGIGYNVVVEFVDKDGTGNYKMTLDPSQGIRI